VYRLGEGLAQRVSSSVEGKTMHPDTKVKIKSTGEIGYVVKVPREVIEYFMHNGEGASCNIRMRNALIEYVKGKTNGNTRIESQEEGSGPAEAA